MHIELDIYDTDAFYEEVNQPPSIITQDWLEQFGKRKKQTSRRTFDEAHQLLQQLNARAFSLAYKRVFKHGLRIEAKTGYSSTISHENARKIENALATGQAPATYAALERDWFVPEIIVVDMEDLYAEITEVIYGILRHEIGEVLFNNWCMYILRQHQIEQTAIAAEMGEGWGKEYGMFINAVGDPRINRLVSRMSHAAATDIRYAELNGICMLVDKIANAPVHIQFLLLVNCREAELYAHATTELIKTKVEPTALQVYEANKTLITAIAEAEEIRDFYTLANRLWPIYLPLIDASERGLNAIKQLIHLLPMPMCANLMHDKRNDLLLPAAENVARTNQTSQLQLLIPTEKSRRTRLTSTNLDHLKVQQSSKTLAEDANEKADGDDEVCENGEAPDDLSAKPGGSRLRGNGIASMLSRGLGSACLRVESLKPLCNRFAAILNDFMPIEAPDAIFRQRQGTIDVASFINTCGLSEEINTQIVPNQKVFSVFSVIVDNSGSTAGEPISAFKKVAYVLCDSFSQKQIAFELLNYGNFETNQRNDIDNLVIHSLNNGSNFTTKERSRLANLDAFGGQFDTVCLINSASRVLPYSEKHECTPFFLLICDGWAEFSLNEEVKKLSQKGAVVLGVGVGIDEEAHANFKETFGRHALLVSSPARLVEKIAAKLKTEVARTSQFIR